MTKIVWTIAWVFIALWSAMAAMTYWMFEGLAGLAARNADQMSPDPQTVEWLSELALWTQNISAAAIVFVWAAVAAGVVFCAWIIVRMMGGTSYPPSPPAR